MPDAYLSSVVPTDFLSFICQTYFFDGINVEILQWTEKYFPRLLLIMCTLFLAILKMHCFGFYLYEPLSLAHTAQFLSLAT